MTTYRTGRHWGVTIVRDGIEPIEMGKRADDQLVAVVTNGDYALAERICALLNGEPVRSDWLDMIQDLTDPDECIFDRQGSCLTHNWYETDPPCPHGRAQAMLKAEGREP